MNKYLHILNSSGHLTEEAIKGYVQKKYGKDETHIIEEHFSDCEMCCDAIEGFMTLGNIEIESFNTPTKDFFNNTNILKPIINKKWYQQSWAIAASFLLVISTMALFISKNFQSNDKELAKVETKNNREVTDTTTSTNTITTEQDSNKNIDNQTISETKTIVKENLPPPPLDKTEVVNPKKDIASAPPVVDINKEYPPKAVIVEETKVDEKYDIVSNENDPQIAEDFSNRELKKLEEESSKKPRASSTVENIAVGKAVSKSKNSHYPAPASNNNSYNNNENLDKYLNTNVDADYTLNKKAIDLYNALKIKKSVREFEHNLNATKDKSLSYYYLGLCYIQYEINKPEVGKKYLQMAIDAKGKYSINADQFLKTLK